MNMAEATLTPFTCPDCGRTLLADPERKPQALPGMLVHPAEAANQGKHPAAQGKEIGAQRGA